MVCTARKVRCGSVSKVCVRGAEPLSVHDQEEAVAMAAFPEGVPEPERGSAGEPESHRRSRDTYLRWAGCVVLTQFLLKLLQIKGNAEWGHVIV